MSEIYKIKNFSFKYPFQESGINIKGEFVINKGETVLIAGESGSGKTTLLYALKGLIPEVIYGILKGNITFKNKKITHLSQEEKLKIGMIFQNPSAQMLNRRVIDELAFGLENLKYSQKKIKQEIENISNLFGISGLLQRELNTLSGGEKQKIALLSILITKPEVILFDEPTAFLDPISAGKFIEIFKTIIGEKTILIVEHNLDYLKNFVNKIVSIKNNTIFLEDNFIWDYKLPTIAKSKGDKVVLTVERLKFSYNKKNEVLKNINLELFEGEIIGIKGNNGAGKSTFLKLLARLLKPKEGDIFLLGKKNYKLKDYYKKIGLLMQNPENHFLFSKVKNETSIKILNLLGLGKLALMNPFTLSEGEKRRLSIGILLNSNPKVILMDEPTFGQDYKNKVNLIEVLKNLKDKGHSFVIVSHDIPFLKSVSNRILTLENGVLHENE